MDDANVSIFTGVKGGVAAPEERQNSPHNTCAMMALPRMNTQDLQPPLHVPGGFRFKVEVVHFV